MNLFKIIMIFSILYFDYLIVKINPLVGIILVFAEILFYIKIKGKIFGIPIKRRITKNREDSASIFMEKVFENAFKNIIKSSLKKQLKQQNYQNFKKQEDEAKFLSNETHEIDENSNQFIEKWDLNQIKIADFKKFFAILGLYSLFLAGIAAYQLFQLPFDKNPFKIFWGIFLLISFFSFYLFRTL